MINTNLTGFLAEFEELRKMFPPFSDDISIFGQVENGVVYANCNILDISEKIEKYIGDCTPIEEKRYLKRWTKLALYRAISKRLNISLPWGALTGIRPVKFAREVGDFKTFFTDEMEVSSSKVDLVEDIINTQNKINIDTNLIDLYVGIPFCPTRCNYCSFVSNAINKNTPINEYIDVLCKEIAAGKHLFEERLGTVYIGGGTPASLNLENTEKLLKTLNVKKGIEFTVEAGRPDCIDSEKLSLYKAYNVTRVCVNPQTFNDKTLKVIGRAHTGQDAIEKFKLAKSFGFIVNTDLIAGLSGESVEDFKYSLDTAVGLGADNVTVHTLCLKAGSKIKVAGEKLDGTHIGEMLDYSYKVCKESGYNPYYLYRQKYMAGNYENVGYAKSGAECKYNIGIMEEITDNVSFGAGANSKIVLNNGERLERYYPPRDVLTYINKIDKIIEEKNKLFALKGLIF